jgi:hypothetical protein
MQASDDELKAYYDKHKTDYNISSRKRRFATYLSIRQVRTESGGRDPDLHASPTATASVQTGRVRIRQIVPGSGRPDLDSAVKDEPMGW